MIAFSNDLNIVPELSIATDRINTRLPKTIVKDVLLKYPKAKSFGVVGLAYKARTNITDASQTVEIANILAELNKEVLVFDQLEFDLNILNSKIQLANRISDFEKCDLVIVSKEHEQDINSLMKNKQNIIIF
jgi:UDP-glucose 6-dehydrogenase